VRGVLCKLLTLSRYQKRGKQFSGVATVPSSFIKMRGLVAHRGCDETCIRLFIINALVRRHIE